MLNFLKKRFKFKLGLTGEDKKNSVRGIVDDQAIQIKENILEKKDLNEHLKSEIEESEKKLNLLTSLNINLTLENDNLCNQMFQSQEELELSIDKNRVLCSEMELISRNNYELLSKQGKLDKELSDAKHKLNTLIDLKGGLEKINTDQSNRNQILEVEVFDLEKKCEKLSDWINLAKKNSAIEESKILAYVNEIENLKLLGLSRIDECNQWEEQLDVLQDSLEKALNHQDVKNRTDKELYDQQLLRLRSELNNLFDENDRLTSIINKLERRWLKLERDVPNYVGFDQIEIESIVQSISGTEFFWRVENLIFGGAEELDLRFKLVISDGLCGIEIIPVDSAANNKGNIFYPSKALEDGSSKVIFDSISNKEWIRLCGVANLLDVVNSNNYRSVSAPLDFDPSFWKPIFGSLVKSFKDLPKRIRYESVNLLRELKNPDYEHLWIDIRDLTFGTQRLRRFELRIASAEMTGALLSQFPKLEIPLVDSKIKPFLSWYAESRDEFGPKFELRFNLNKSIFDVKSFSRLDIEDRLFIAHLLFSLPDLIVAISKNSKQVSRNWQEWIEYSQKICACLKMGPTIKDVVEAKNKNKAFIDHSQDEIDLKNKSAPSNVYSQTSRKKEYVVGSSTKNNYQKSKAK